MNAVPFFIDHADYAYCSSSDEKKHEKEFYQAEWRRWIRDLIHPPESSLFLDTFREMHPLAREKYTCWNTLTSARDSNYGTRIDFILFSRKQSHNYPMTVTDAAIHPEIMGSDHCPVSVAFTLKDSNTLVEGNNLMDLKKLAFYYHVNDNDGRKSIASFFKKAPPPITKDSSSSTMKKQQAARKPASSSRNISSFFKPVKRNIDELLNDDEIIEIVDSSSDGDAEAEATTTDEPKSDPSDAAKAWKQVFQSKRAIPLCHGHKEPCKALKVNKKGVNQGRMFYMCARPIGPDNHPNKEQFRCKHFEWANKKAKKTSSAL